MTGPFIKHYIMTAGPTPLPPAVSQVDGGAHPVPPRARLHRDLRALPRQPSACPSRPRATCWPSRVRARGPWSRRWPTSRGRASRRSSPRCGKFGERWAELTEAFGAELRSTTTPAGATASSPPTSSALLAENAGDARSSSRRCRRPPPASSTTSSGSPRWPTRHGALIVVDAVSGLGAVPVPAGRVGRRRGRRRARRRR